MLYCKRIYSVDILLEDCCKKFKLKKSLRNHNLKSFTDEIHEYVFQKDEIQKEFDNIQDPSFDFHAECMLENICEAQSFDEENVVLNHFCHEDQPYNEEIATKKQKDAPRDVFCSETTKDLFQVNNANDHLDCFSNQPIYDEYDIGIEVRIRESYKELYSNPLIEKEEVHNCFDAQTDGSHIEYIVDIISNVSNSHGHDNFDVQNYYEHMPIFY